jgi:6-phosphogluconate dehydrogenase
MNMKIGFVGLGKMGAQIVSKLIAGGIDVVVMDVNESAVAAMVARGATAAKDKVGMVNTLGIDPIVWLMIPSQFVEDEVTAWSTVLPKGALLIDGGNSDWRLTRSRGAMLAEHKISFMDAGTSGGVLGLKEGFSFMVGGDAGAYARITPLLDLLSAPHGGHAHMGETASGHYVKMVHNGIEYGMMQSFAEGYQLLREGPIVDIPLEKVSEVWQKGSIINSTLNGLINEIMHEDKDLSGVDGYVADSGEGKWTLEVAATAKVPTPALAAAIEVRKQSQTGITSYATKLLAAMRNKFGGHAINKN